VAAGDFTEIDGDSARFVACWDGTSWEWMRGITSTVWAMGMMDGDLFAGGFFQEPFHFARWTGSVWEGMGSGTNSPILGFGSANGSLYAVGKFETAGTTSNLYIARWTPNTTGIGEEPRPTIVLSAYPNPFRASTTLLYELDHPGLVTLAAFDVQGRQVSTLFEGPQAAGTYRQRWTGLDRHGVRLPAGVYYLRLRTDGQVTVRPIVLTH
jgi:hypothetical protein